MTFSFSRKQILYNLGVWGFTRKREPVSQGSPVTKGSRARLTHRANRFTWVAKHSTGIHTYVALHTVRLHNNSVHCILYTMQSINGLRRPVDCCTILCGQ